MVEVNLVK